MPSRQQQGQPQYLDEHHQRIAEFGADYFDDEEEREAFVSELMSRRGYTARTRTEWEPPAEDPKSNGSGQGGGQRQKPAYFRK